MHARHANMHAQHVYQQLYCRMSCTQILHSNTNTLIEVLVLLCVDMPLAKQQFGVHKNTASNGALIPGGCKIIHAEVQL